LRRYAVLDVFTDTPLGGNPLAVVLDGDALDAEQMQAVAGEFNLSETVFVLPPANPIHRANVRIFTPRRELPFAGHPTVGAAVMLGLVAARENRGREEAMMVLEEKAGPVRCGVTVHGPSLGHAIFDVPQKPASLGEVPSVEAAAAALGLMPSEVGFENHSPSAYSAGLAFRFVPVRDLEVIGRAKPSPGWEAAFGPAGGAFLYCRETIGSGNSFHARMFAPGFGIAEDPATGSAVAALAGVIQRFDAPPAGAHRFVVEQGFEMGRPSTIMLEMDIEDGAIAAARIAGDAVVIAEGMLAI
jgi:trans-2,3-dihydro-3-hydroxyanthranilate isomerase